jgi:hypothetical protein
VQATLRHRLKHAWLISFLLVAAAGWSYLIYNEHRANDPMEIIKKHFVFYPDYSGGVWREEACIKAYKEKCREVTYIVSVKGCGPVTFDWRVFPGEGGDTTWSYQGARPSVDESKYRLYAIVNGDSRFIDPPALGTAPPTVCQVK